MTDEATSADDAAEVAATVVTTPAESPERPYTGPLDIDWDGIEEHAKVAPFAMNRMGPSKITGEQYLALTHAGSKARRVPEDQWLKE